MRRWLRCHLALTLIAYLALTRGFGAVAAPATYHTEVIFFRPPLPSRTTATQSGRCWTESIAVNRPGAWRCMDKNMIFDPCFEISA